jgi:hypothetical protein
MNDNGNLGFGKFVPGFDFLQNLAKGASQTLPQLPNLSNWVAPTLNVEELDKRINDLKAVHFWLDQNAKALGATIQALEVQKMTLATLKGMNFNMGDVANALKLKAADTMMSGVQKAGEVAAGAAGSMTSAATNAVEKTRAARKKANPDADAPGSGIVDPLQWWGALTTQFQQIAANAMKDAATSTARDTARQMAAGMAREAVKSAKKTAQKGAAKRATKRGAKNAAKKAAH